MASMQEARDRKVYGVLRVNPDFHGSLLCHMEMFSFVDVDLARGGMNSKPMSRSHSKTRTGLSKVRTLRPYQSLSLALWLRVSR